MIFNNLDIEKISNLFDSQPQIHDSGYTWTIKNEELKDKLILTLYTNITDYNDNKINLVSIITQMGTLELHNCNSYLLFEPDEVIFISSENDKVSSLIVGKKGTTSLYSNIDRSMLNADITELDSAFLMSVMQLSLTEAM